MNSDKQRQKEQLERTIRNSKRSLDNPWTQDRWVERDTIAEAQRKLNNLNQNRKNSR